MLKNRVLAATKGRSMPALNSISAEQLFRLIGTPTSPDIIDVRIDEDFTALPSLIPSSIRRRHGLVDDWALEFKDRKVAVTCYKGGGISAGVAAHLRAAGIEAESLEGGVRGWAAKGLPLVPESVLPKRDAAGRTLWVTRARPKVDRIACPWLIRRFADRHARFLFVTPTEIEKVAERFSATPFDVDGVEWSHRGENCTFDMMVQAFGLSGVRALARLALIVRGADTDRPDLTPQSAGLLAASLGLSRMYSDDHQQLDAGMLLYDAFYRWCRDAVDETHDWVSHQPRQKLRL
jgi:rhodanese-related sulfurtransferase